MPATVSKPREIARAVPGPSTAAIDPIDEANQPAVAPAANATAELTVDKVNVGDTKITGKAEKNAKVEFFRNDVNKPEKSVTANAEEGSFIINLATPIADHDRIWMRQTVGGTAGDLISVDVVAPELAAPVIDAFLCWKTKVVGTAPSGNFKYHRRVEGRGTPGQTVQIFFDDNTKATPDDQPIVTGAGTFESKEAEFDTDQGNTVWVRAKAGDKFSKFSASDHCTDPSDAFLVGLAPFGLVMSQQSEQFSQSDPFGGFIVGNVWPFGTYNENLGRTKSSYNLRFQLLMQPEARTSMAPAQTATGTPATPSAPPTTFISSRKSVDIEGHMWWEVALNKVFSFGPYGAFGGATVLNKNEGVGEDVSTGQGSTGAGAGRTVLDTTRLITTNDMKKYYEYGLLMDFYSGRKGDANLYIQAILAKGWYEALANLDGTGHDTRDRFIGKLRVFPFGLNRAFLARGTVSPMFGVDLNAGRGQDYVRFFVGMAFNVTQFLDRAKQAIAPK
jgi:hypothetical protein